MKIVRHWLNRIFYSKFKQKQALVDETSLESFPASDPPAWIYCEQPKTVIETDPSEITLAPEWLQQVKQTLTVNGINYYYFSLSAAERVGLTGLSRLPFTLKSF